MIAAICPGNCLKRCSTLRKIVERGYRDVVEHGFDNAKSAGNGIGRTDIAEVFFFRLNAHQRSVMKSVVCAFEPQNLVTSRGGTCDSAGVHRRFCTTVSESHHLYRITRTDFFGEFVFHAVRHSESGAAIGDVFHRFDNCWMSVPCHQGPETKVVIDVFVAVDVC